MGVLQNPLGISLTDYMPIINSPFNNSDNQGQSFPPPGSEFMITEDNKLMLTEDGLNLMITE